MGIVRADHRGRVTLGKEVVSKYGQRFDIVPTGDKVVLVPVPDDPVKDLRRIARQTGMSRLTPAAFKREASRLAEQEALANWGRRGRKG